MISSTFSIATLFSTTLNLGITTLQASPWNPIIDFLNALLNPLFDLWENYSLRATILSTIIWSFLVTCGLVFILLESPSIISLFSGKQEMHTQQRRTSKVRHLRTEAKPEIQKATRKTENQEGQNGQSSSNKTGVHVSSIIKKHHDKIAFRVTITNGSDSKIDMVVVDLELPKGIETDIGSFRMQRVGSIESGESATTEFALKSMGGDPTKIQGQVEFLGASYEVSKVPISKPNLED